MRFFIWGFIMVIIVSFSFPQNGQTEEALPVVSAESAILIEKETGRVLFEHDAYEQKEIASITKIMTALVAIQYGDLDDTVKVSKKAVFTPGSSIYLEINEQMTLRDLLYGLMLRSGNDAAVAIAEHVGGSEEGFVYLMNETAQYLGMTDSHFMNAHGLDEEGHYSTAYDMALLMKHAMENDTFMNISGETSYKSDKRHYAWQNKNKLLTMLYEPCTGGKTGYTKQAGRTLVSSAKDHGMDLIAVTLNAPDDWNDHINLYNYGYKHYSIKMIEKQGFKKYQLLQKEVTGYVEEDIVYPLREDEIDLVKKHVDIYNQQKLDETGKIRITLNDQELLDKPLFKENLSFMEQMGRMFIRLIGIDRYG